jgi:cyclic pyranopterin phosphate synthase
LLRDSLVDDKDIRQAIQTVWTERTDRYSEMRTLSTAHVSKVEMSHIGG